MPKKIVFTGPECSGKSTMSRLISQEMCWPLVEEFARTYFAHGATSYDLEDLIRIADGQRSLEGAMNDTSHPAIICDTNILTILLWSRLKFGRIPNELWALWHRDHTDLYLLCKPDFPYHWDPLREDYHNRSTLFDIYLLFLIEHQLPFDVLRGSVAQRRNMAVRSIQSII